MENRAVKVRDMVNSQGNSARWRGKEIAFSGRGPPPDRPAEAQGAVAQRPPPLSSPPMIRPVLVAAAATGLLAMGVTRSASLDGRMAQLEEAARRRQSDSLSVGALADQVEQEGAALREALAAVEGSAAEARALGAELESVRAQLRAAEESLVAQRGVIEELGARATALAEEKEGADARMLRLVDAVEATASLVSETRDQLIRVENRVSADSGTQWRSMVAPTVQLAGETTVGSGVLLPSRPQENDPTRFTTLLLTSWHVVRDIRADSREENCPIPVVLRDENGRNTHFTARLVAHDVPLDAALLELETDLRLDHAAQLPSRARLAASRVFDPVVAVGCPLGNDPIPTDGHVSDLHHKVGGERFWMISAPTYIGNSGGGIYSAESRELLGIFSKIYTHGAIRPTVIPHMGLVTPLEEFYDWIDGTDVARVIESEDGAVVVLTRD